MSMDAPKPFKEIPNLAVAQLHAAYEQETGIQLPLNRAFNREYAWGSFMAQGWTEGDLRLVIKYLRHEFKDYWLKMVRFSRLIEDHSGFEEWLAMARAESRNAPKPTTARQDVLKAVGRGEAPEKRDEFTTPKEIFAKGLEELRKKAGL